MANTITSIGGCTSSFFSSQNRIYWQTEKTLCDILVFIIFFLRVLHTTWFYIGYLLVNWNIPSNAKSKYYCNCYWHNSVNYFCVYVHHFWDSLEMLLLSFYFCSNIVFQIKVQFFDCYFGIEFPVDEHTMQNWFSLWSATFQSITI